MFILSFVKCHRYHQHQFTAALQLLKLVSSTCVRGFAATITQSGGCWQYRGDKTLPACSVSHKNVGLAAVALLNKAPRCFSWHHGPVSQQHLLSHRADFSLSTLWRRTWTLICVSFMAHYWPTHSCWVHAAEPVPPLSAPLPIKRETELFTVSTSALL